MVTGAELIERYDDIRGDLESLGVATYFLELIDQLTEAGEGLSDIFYLLKATLDFLRQGHSPKRAARIFEVKLMKQLGLLSQMDRCLRCGSAPSGTPFFSIASGGLVCDACRAGEGPVIALNRGALVFLDQIYKKPVGELGQLKVAREVGIKVEQTLRRFVDFHLSRKPKSLIFLEKIAVS